MSGTNAGSKADTNPSSLDKALGVHERVLERAMAIADKRPATALQSVGIYIVIGAVLLKALSTVTIGGISINFQTDDFVIMMICGTLFMFGSSYISLAEYKDQVRWYDDQLRISGANSQRALDVIASHAAPPAAADKPHFGGNGSATLPQPAIR